MKRSLGRSGIEVSAVGMGCWAIGGPWNFLGSPAGWSVVDDEESIRAIHAGLANGATFFDTAANYGCGHSELLLGRALKGRRQDAVIASKFGYRVDTVGKNVSPYGENEEKSDPARFIRADLEGSLTRLGMDTLDVYQLHVWGLEMGRALEVRAVLDDLVQEGKIRTYGWSTDREEAVMAFSTSAGCGVVQQQLNIFDGNAKLLALCEELDLASINRAPLGMGLLTGKFTPETTFRADDVRAHARWFPGLKDGKPSPAWLDALDKVRQVLTSGGRTLTQGALAWLWGRSPMTVPIPGFKTVAQVEENCRAMTFGPLMPAEMAEIETILGR